MYNILMDIDYAWMQQKDSDPPVYDIWAKGRQLIPGMHVVIKINDVNTNCTIIKAYASHPYIPEIQVYDENGNTFFVGNINDIVGFTHV